MDKLQLTVSEFNQIFADIIHNQLQLNQLCIQGEITQLNSYHDHLYITLSENKAHLPCVIYNASNKNLPFIKKGDQCEVIGQCRYLKNKGQLIFSGAAILTKGTGQKLHSQTQKINHFRKMGKFEIKTTSEIPNIIEKVCIITASDSAAFHDVFSILKKSAHLFDVIHIPSSVQGLNAENELINALSIAESLNPDIICITRGGGGEQDFDCYFSEKIAEKMLTTSQPILCGIGHKINVTLCCHIANMSFETPTAMIQWLCNFSINIINEQSEKLKMIKNQLLTHGESLLNQIKTLNQRNLDVLNNNTQLLKLKEKELQEKLILLNPFNRLSNGFIYCEDSKKKPLNSIQQISSNDNITLRLKDGFAKAEILNVNKKTT